MAEELGNITVNVEADGAEDAAQQAQDGAAAAEDGMQVPETGGEGGADGGGGLAEAIGGGVFGGLLSQAIGPLLEILDPMLQVLEAFLAPLAVMLLRVLQPVLRFLLTRVLPRWLEFMSFVNGMIENLGVLGKIATLISTIAGGLAGAKIGALVGGIIGGFLGSVVPGIGTAVGAAVGAKVGGLIGAFVGGITGGVTMSALASWLQQNLGAIRSLPGRIQTFMSDLFNELTTAVTNLPSRIAEAIGGGVSDARDRAANFFERARNNRVNRVQPAQERQRLIDRASERTNVDLDISLRGGLDSFVEEITANDTFDIP